MVKVERLGHIVLRVRDLERAERFYTGVLGFKVSGRIPGAMTFFTLGEQSHDLAVLSVGPNAPAPDPHRVGLYHFALRLATFDDLKAAYRTLQEKGVPIIGAVDHGVSQGIYLRDPDGNEIELYYELPPEAWPDRERPLDRPIAAPLALE